MKKVSILSFCILLSAFVSCNSTPEGLLFNGEDMKKWTVTGDVSLQNRIMTLSGTESKAVLKKAATRTLYWKWSLEQLPAVKGLSVFIPGRI
jgi:hypothetical protein